MPRSTNVFAPVVVALVLTAVSIASAIVSWNASTQYLPEQNSTQPPLAEVPPFLGAPALPCSRASGAASAPNTSATDKCLTKRVILIIVDGLRLRDSFGHPAIDRLRRSGADTIARAPYPTISRPNHTTLVTGVPPLLSGVRNNHYSAPVALDSIMDRLRVLDLTSAFVADYSPSLAYLFSDDFDTLSYARWPNGFVNAARHALRQEHAFVVFIPGLVDEAGHKDGGDSPEYRSAIDRVDAQVATILSLVDLQRDTVILTSDHGHTDKGGHGGTEASVVDVPLIFAGAGVRPGALLEEADLEDIAPTIAALLGVPAPGHSVGRTLVELIDLPAHERKATQETDQRRLDRNATVQLQAVDKASPKQDKRQRSRLTLLAAMVALVCVGLWFAKRWGALIMDWRVLLIALPAFPLCYYAFLDVVGNNLSFSSMPEHGEAMRRLLRFGLLSVAVQLTAGWAALAGRVVLRDRLASANALVACGLLIAGIPAGLMWATYVGPHLEIPGPSVALLIPAIYVAVATFATGGSVLLILEIVIFFARAVDPRVRLRRLERAAAKERLRLSEDNR